MSNADAPSKETIARKVESLIFVRIPHFLAGVLFFIAMLINIANVIGRYVFSAPVFWAEEVLVFIIVWTCSMQGWGRCSRHRSIRRSR